MRTTTLFSSVVASLSLLSGCPAEEEPQPQPPIGAPSLSLLAGSSGSSGNLDGSRERALFLGPSGVAKTSDGSLFVADTSNLTIRKISPDGVVSTVAGRSGESGTEDGPGADARFLLPVAIVADADDNLYVSDTVASTIRRITPDGTVETWVGAANQPGVADGPRATARLLNPEGLAVDDDGTLYVADRGAHTVRRVSPDGAVDTFVGAPNTPGSDDGPRAQARLAGPFAVALHEDGTLAISDADNNTLRLVSPAGDVTTLAGTPGGPQSTEDGTGAEAGFGRPRALAWWHDGGLLVGDTFNDRIRHVTREGVVTTWAGNTYGYEDGPRAEASMSFPSGFEVAVEGDGEDDVPVLYSVDGGTSLLRRITDDTVETWAGRPPELEYQDGPALEARFFKVNDALALDDGSVLLVDSVNSVIRRIDESKNVETWAGTQGVLGADDGPRAEATFNSPSAIVSDGDDGFYVADQGNHSIRHIDASGQVTLFAGGTVGRGPAIVDGPVLTAQFFFPGALALGSDGTLYVADAGNHAIRSIKNGIVDTVAGDGLPGFLEGFGSQARFNLPADLVVVEEDGEDVLYVADALNSVIRKVTVADKAVTVLAGTKPIDDQPELGDADGTGVAASFHNPFALIADPEDANALLVADTNNSLLRRVTLGGEVTTVAGTRGSVGVVEGALPGSLFEPAGLGVGPDGAVLVTFATGVLRIGR